MKFARTDEQRLFGIALHELLADANVPTAARAWACGEHEPGLAIWRELANAGVCALMVPESCGGLGAHPVDLVVACEELGKHPVPGPLAESIAAVPVLLASLASEAAERQAEHEAGQRAREWLAGLASGELIATLAMPPSLPYALDADVAGLVLLARPDNGDAPSITADGAASSAASGSRDGTVWRALPRTGFTSVDRTRRLYEVWPGRALAAGPLAGAAARRGTRFGTLASAALLLGAGRGLLAQSTAHATTRQQFGRPVGAFQAVKHALANVLIGLEFAGPLLNAAAIALNGNAPTADRDISAARVACADAARRAARTALQVHGAIGYTQECDVSLWLAKVRALSSNWGSQAEHRAIVLAALGAAGSGPWD
jgi:alkylation response protein AidB-like acyl-CoA dehydrogenase